MPEQIVVPHNHADTTQGDRIQPVTKTLYVDKNRTDAYVEDGSVLRPFKTIMGAVNQVIANNDNIDPWQSYHIYVAPGTYDENIILEHANLHHLVFDGQATSDNGVIVKPTTGSAVRSKANNSGLTNLSFTAFRFMTTDYVGPVVDLEGVNGGNFMFSDDIWVDCLFDWNVSVVNALAFTAAACSFFNNVSFVNCGAAGIGAESTVYGALTNTYNAGGPQPGPGYPFGSPFVVVANMLAVSNITCGAGTIMQSRLGARLGVPGASLTIDGAFTAYSSYIRSDISISATGSLTNRGSQYGGSLTVLGTYSNPSPLPIRDGGTGAVTQQAAINSLSGLSAKGSILVHNGTNAVPQTVGNNGDVLVADSGQANGVKWQAGPAAAGIQAGQQAIGSGVDTITVTFPTAFGSAPKVVISMGRPAGSDMVYAVLDSDSVTATQFTAHLSDLTPDANYVLGWIAIP